MSNPFVFSYLFRVSDVSFFDFLILDRKLNTTVKQTEQTALGFYTFRKQIKRDFFFVCVPQNNQRNNTNRLLLVFMFLPLNFNSNHRLRFIHLLLNGYFLFKFFSFYVFLKIHQKINKHISLTYACLCV